MTVDVVPFKHQRASLGLIRNRKDIPYVFLIGGYGCLTGESKISTPSGPVPLYKFEGGLVNTPIGPRNASWPIPSPSHIVQVEGDGFQIHCNGDHQLQCSELLSRKLDNPQWVDVHSLQALNLSLLFLGPTKQDNDLPIQPLDVLHWKKTVEDCLYGYLAYYHFDDELLHLLVTGDPGKIPLQECVQTCNNLFPSENGDDETVLVCTRLWWQMNLLYMHHSKNPSDLLSFVSEYHKSEDCRRLREHFYQATVQSPCLKDFVLPTLQELESIYEIMASATSSVAKIIAEDGNQIHLRKITYSGRDTIYRLHVEEAECYYADGILHHNCGKSFTDVQLLCVITAAYMNSPVPLTFGIIGVTIKLLGQTVLKDFKGFLDSANIPYSDNMMKGQLKVGSITFIYLAMSNPGDIYAHNFCGALVDEMDELPAEKVLEVVKAVQERCRVHMPPPFDRDPFIFFSTTAQGLGGTYQLCEYFKKKGLPYAIVKGKTEYNTSLAKTQIELLRKLYTEEEAKAYLDGEFVNLTTGRVYPEFDRKKHVCMRFPIQPTETIYVGQDFNMGYNASSECIVREGHIFIVNSHHWDYMGDAPRRLREMYPTNPIVMIPDASGKEIMSGFSDEMSEAHIQLHWNGKNASITERIMAVNKALSWGQLSVMEPTSDKDSLQDRVIMGLETRDFDDTGKPRKGRGPDALDHGCFIAGTLIMTSEGEKPIELIKKGDKVLSHDGKFHEVKWAGKTGHKKVISRLGLIGTPNHPIANCHNKYVSLCDASEYNKYDKEALQWWRQLYLMESRIAGIRTQKGKVTELISELELTTSNAMEFASCTGTYGLIIMDLYQKAMRYITRMKTRQTMIFQILNVYRWKNTIKSILSKEVMSLQKKIMIRQRLGTRVQKGTSGEINLGGNTYASAPGVTKNLSQSRENQEGIATIRAKSFAVEAIPPHTIAQSEEDVYNLSVTGTHTYFANGILVHNCDSTEYAVFHIIQSIQGFDKILDVLRATFHRSN